MGARVAARVGHRARRVEVEVEVDRTGLDGLLGVVQVRPPHGRHARHHDGRRRHRARSSRRWTGRRRPPTARARPSSSSDAPGPRPGRERHEVAGRVRPVPGDGDLLGGGRRAERLQHGVQRPRRQGVPRRADRRGPAPRRVVASTNAAPTTRGSRDGCRAGAPSVGSVATPNGSDPSPPVGPPHATTASARLLRPQLLDRDRWTARAHAKPAAPPTGSRA